MKYLSIVFPPVLAIILVLINGGLQVDTSGIYDKNSYYIQLIVTLFVLAYVPLSLRYIHPSRMSAAQYKKMARIRLLANVMFACVLIVAYFYCLPMTAFAYLAVILWLSTFFCLSI